MNLRPCGYEPHELTGLLHPAIPYDINRCSEVLQVDTWCIIDLIYIRRRFQMAEVVRRSKGLSIASMVLGICSIILFIWLGFILGVLAIIFAGIELKRNKNGMAVAGLVTGIVGTVLSFIVGIAIVASIMRLPYGNDDYTTSYQASLVETAAINYATENNGTYPSFEQLESALSDDYIDVTISREGRAGDIVYIPCYGDGGIIWHWNSSQSDYLTINLGSTDNCEWREY